ncbi:RDD family protein [Thiohalophilus thiocyanatoxydans]|uniref:Putative RDD family membrane protein YckC n=1 Tax=Thiohalophilus thiocyanatoxydans TaxID=381308 RepID=A0A4R8IY91_9GAMM|nr:RDD family protein [Thiohalophilus thiocyanatoxydans]TDY02383.1 putative RDD family membrane protein YckC [Thiohalophilus thiocyanatoxydans]
MEEQQETKWICGFWRRIGALIVDVFVLGVVGFALGQVFGELFIELGGLGRLLGFAIALVYFGVLNSSIGNGQTLGKRLLGIRVVDEGNNPIGLLRSFARYVVLGLPFFLNGIQLGGEALIYLAFPLSVIIFGGGLAIVYLYVFNRVTRQSLHDLVVGTYVVNAAAPKQAVGPVWKPHLVVVTVLFVTAAVVPAFTLKLADDSPLKEMLSIHATLIKNPLVRFANVTMGSTIHNMASDDSTTTNHVTVKVFVARDVLDDSELARQMARTVIAGYPQAMDRDLIQVTLIYGFDIGIWSQWRSQSYNFEPEELATDI